MWCTFSKQMSTNASKSINARLDHATRVNKLSTERKQLYLQIFIAYLVDNDPSQISDAIVHEKGKCRIDYSKINDKLLQILAEILRLVSQNR